MYRNKRLLTINFSRLTPYLPFIIFSILYLVGVLLGSLLIRFHIGTDIAVNLFDDFYSIRQSLKFYNIIKNSVFNTFVPFIIIFISGTSIVGCVFIPIVLTVIGMKFGILVGYLYATYKLNGIMFSSFILLPLTIVALFGMVLLSIEAFKFSKMLSSICIMSNKPINIYLAFRIYCVKGSITLISALVSVVLDVCMTSLFINYFSF